jgi:hypothetical protein
MGDLNCDLLEEDKLIILRRILRREKYKKRFWMREIYLQPCSLQLSSSVQTTSCGSSTIRH